MKRRERWWVPDVIDLHIYGGVALLGAGIDFGLYGTALAGVTLLALGIRMS